jgi:TonB-linked SusC/RagA family outer membrane protein
MQLTAMILLVACLHVSAGGIAQTITLSEKNASLEKIINKVKKQSGYDCWYENGPMMRAEKMDIHVSNAPLEEVLNLCFRNKPLTWSIVGKIIVIRSAGKESKQPVFAKEAEIVVAGIVMDSVEDKPLEGVSVAVQPSSAGTKTDAHGQYSIQVPENSVLSFTYVGYEQKLVRVGRQTSINVRLAPSDRKLDQIVVVGYGTQRNASITGSIATVSSKELKDPPVAQIGQSLQGKLAGVRISQTTGTPGSGLKFQIRGSVSLTAGSDPLYVVDGMPISGDLSFMNPYEIETITVLKDPAAASLYGSRAANGVILVQTKAGVTGKTRIDVNAYAGFEAIPQNRRLKMMDGTEYAQFQNDIANTNGRPVNAAFENPAQFGKGTDWLDAITRKGAIQSYNVTLSSGTEKFKVSATAGYFNQQGVVVGSGFERYSLRINAKYQASDKLVIGFNVAPTFTHNTNLNTDGGPYGTPNLISAAIITTPLAKPYNPDGTLALTASDPATFGNPNWLRVAKDKVYQDKNLRLLANGYVEYKIIKGLVAKSTINIQANNDDLFQFSPSTIGTLFSPPPRIPSGSDYLTRYMNVVNENTLDYQKRIGDKHNIDVLVGFTDQSYRGDGEYITGTNYPDDKVQTLNAAGTTSISSDIQEWSLISYLARLNYQYDNKYLFSASIRRDGSSRFGPDNRYGNFPAVSAGWIISREDFWKFRPVSFLKVRASYGVTGNFEIGNYSSISSVGNTYYPFGNSVAAGRALSNLSDKNLGWENNKQSDIGVDVNLFNDRIQLTYDYYNRYATNLLFNVQVPVSSGFSNLQTNVGELKFWGHEISVRAAIIKSRNLTWNSSFNISFDRNKTLALSTQNGTLAGGISNYGFNSNVTAVGLPISLFFGAVHDGVYKNQQDFDSSPKNPLSAVGTVKFRDLNGDGVITFPEDMTYIGSPWPKYSFGMTNTVEYRNFDFSVAIAGTYGNKILAFYENWAANLDGVFNVLEDLNNRWKSPSDPGEGNWGSVQAGTTNLERDRFNTRYLKDGSYLSVKNITLGYTISRAQETRFFRTAHIYLSAQNMFILTKYPGGNPEVNTNNSASGASPGIDANSYPLPRTMTVGVNFSF